MWNVVFMGTPDFAVGSLKALLEAGQYHIQAVVTQPDRPKGRGQKMVETPVKTFALQHGLPVFQPLKVKEAEFVQQLKAWQPDFIVVAAFGQFLTQEILDIPPMVVSTCMRLCCLNTAAPRRSSTRLSKGKKNPA